MSRAKAIPETITIHVPFHIVKRGGRKEMHLPEGAAQPRRTDNTLVKALARAFRWKRMLESGEFTTITEIASREALSFTYISRVLRLSMLAPDIVEEIIEGRQRQSLILADLLVEVPTDWAVQRTRWLVAR
jgi:hypothetical protein